MQGVLLAVAAYGIWGCFPLLFHYLSHIMPVEVLSHRIIWSLVATSLLVLLLGRRRHFLKLLTNTKLMLWLAVSSILIAVNWLIFIWAVGQQQVIEASLGYFITPLLSLILARIFLKEQLHPLQIVAGAVALVAVLWELVSLGRLPWIGLSLALAFALYGLIRKLYPVDGINGLTVETLWLFPLAVIWIIWQGTYGETPLAFADNTLNSSLLIASGVLTAVPLVLFAMAAMRADLSVVGFIMYLNPTIQFLIGIFVLNEAYPPQRLVTFIIVWIALGFFVAGMWQMRKRLKISG